MFNVQLFYILLYLTNTHRIKTIPQTKWGTFKTITNLFPEIPWKQICYNTIPNDSKNFIERIH